MKVVIAEDEYISLMALKANLEDLGHEVVGEATDGLAAVNLVTENKPDLVIMDINMPLIDGIEALKRINKKCFIPSIIVSGYHDKELIKRTNEVGVFAYLVKPISEADIKVAIETSVAKFNEFKRICIELKDVKAALEARKYIERAKGILMDTMHLKESEAMRKLQKMSRDKNIKITKLAKKIIEANEIFNAK